MRRRVRREREETGEEEGHGGSIYIGRPEEGAREGERDVGTGRERGSVGKRRREDWGKRSR